MGIDERLDRLTERHEALSQSVELLVANQIELQRTFAEYRKETDERFRETAERFKETDARFRETDARFAQLAQNMTELVALTKEVFAMVRNHEQRCIAHANTVPRESFRRSTPTNRRSRSPARSFHSGRIAVAVPNCAKRPPARRPTPCRPQGHRQTAIYGSP